MTMKQNRPAATEKKQSKQSSYLIILLCFLPIIAINLGFKVYQVIDRYWQENEQREAANQEIEALAGGSDFSYQFSRLAGDFADKFKSLANNDFDDERLRNFVNERAQRIFRWPFPSHDLFIFKKPENSADCQLLLVNSAAQHSRRAISKVFSHLMKINKGEDVSGALDKQNEALVGRILGPSINSETIGRTQRGKTSFATYRFFPHWFLWEFFDVPGKGTYGFMLLTKSDEKSHVAAKLMALRDLRERNGGLGAFLPLFQGIGGSVLQEPLNRSALFKQWVRKNISRVEGKLKKWLEEGIPEVSQVGNYHIFSYLGKGHTHLTVLLRPAVKSQTIPLELTVFNFSFVAFFVLFMIRGILLGRWPNINLRLRFIVTYFLAAALPISLLLLSGYGYLSQYRRATHYKNVSHLQSCIKQFDSRKAQIHEEYRSAFAAAVKDEKLKHLLLEKGANSEEVRERVLGFFGTGPNTLPLMCFALFDENGGGIKYYGGTGELYEARKREADPTIEAFMFPIVSLLRQKIEAYAPQTVFSKLKVSDIQETSITAYKSMTGNDLVDEFDKRRSFPITRQVGVRTASQMHELISIDGHEKFALFLVWDDQMLDAKTFKASQNHFGINNPDLIFLAYRITPQGLSLLVDPGRHVNEEFKARSRTLADKAAFRRSYASRHFTDMSLLAMPSKKYDQTIIIGGTHHFGLESSVEKRLFFFIVVLILVIVVVLLCGYLASRLILDPIAGIRSALAQVSMGRLGVEIVSNSCDELGLLCNEFSTMTHGLRDREKLATLISAQAVEAITSSAAGGKLTGGESFSGVALVSDIRNFTGLCEDYPSDVITEMLNEHFAQMSRIISENGGRIYKFIGDAIEAVFPDDEKLPETASIRAFNAASLMLIQLMKINKQRGKNKQFRYRIGIGLAAGQMYSGSVGSMETRLDYAIIGEPLKSAARCESLSVANQAFPLIVDETIAKALLEKGLKFTPISGTSTSQAFTLHEIGEHSSEILASDSGTSKESVSSDENAKAIKYVVEAGGDSGLSALSSFILGALFLGLISAGIFFGRYVEQEARVNNERVEAVADNLRLIEQLKSDNASRVAFEMNCLKLSVSLEATLPQLPSEKVSAWSDTVKEKMTELSPEEGRPAKYAVFMYDKMFVNSDNLATSSLLVAAGWSDLQLQALQAEVDYRRFIDTCSWDFHLENYVNPIFHNMLGNHVGRVLLHREYFGRVADIKENGRPAYFFWDYLVYRGNTDNFEPAALNEAAIASGANAIAGMVIMSADAEQLKNSLPLLLNSYMDEKKGLILIDVEGQKIFSKNLTQNLVDRIANATDSDNNPVFAINESSITLSGKKYRLLVCHFLEVFYVAEHDWLGMLLLLVSALILWFWAKTIRGQTIINRSLAAKLWLSLLVSAVIPVVTVIFVFGLFLNEDASVRKSIERSETQRFMDLFELRETFADPLAWKFIHERTFSKEMMAIAKKLSADPSAANIASLNQLINSWYYDYEAVDRNLINYKPKDIAVAGRNGWKHATSGKNSEEASQFGLMLEHIAEGIVSGRSQGKISDKVDARAVEGEIFIETGLKTVSSLFGDDISVKLSHGVGLPVLMHVLSGTAGLIIHPVPGFEKPEYVMVWMVLFEYENYLSRIANGYRGKFSIFPVEMHRYGLISRAARKMGRQDLVKMASWITSANLPVSGRVFYDGEWFLAEGRQGIAQLTSLLIALTPEKPIYAAIARNSLYFALALAFSLLLIILIAKNVASDILEPIRSLIVGMQLVGRENFSYRINSSREDELGEVCNSFDRMNKGLEEKKMMGRMVSRSAQKFSLQETGKTSSKADFAFLYIGIPTFDAWMVGSSSEELFRDLKAQVTLVASLIIEAGGDIDKIIGEKILAVFHAENGYADAVKSACAAASKIIKAEGMGQLAFPVAIGVNIGTVIAGVLGVGEKRDFTVIGDAVNVTARIEALAETLRYHRCLFSETISDYLPKECQVREYGQVELKGKSEPLKVFQLIL